MGLRSEAEEDLAEILEEEEDFGWTISLTDPDGLNSSFVGYSNDIGQVINVDTGMVVSGRTASVTLRISTLITAGFSMPQAIEDSTKKPWLVSFDDINGVTYTFKISSSQPDRALGVVFCELELYQP